MLNCVKIYSLILLKSAEVCYVSIEAAGLFLLSGRFKPAAFSFYSVLFPKIKRISFLGNHLIQPIRGINDPDSLELVFRLPDACDQQPRISVL